MKRTLLICDASPLILLAKLDRLDDLLLGRHYQSVLLDCVAEEVLRGPFDPGKEYRLKRFLDSVLQVSQNVTLNSGGSLSRCDQASLAYTQDHPGSWLLADDRLLRRAARAEGCSVVGFPGLLLEAVSLDHLQAKEAIDLLDRAIHDHGYRISIRLYQELLQALEKS